MPEDFKGWVKLGPAIGSGGQSDVFLVRSPIRQAECDLSKITIGETIGSTKAPIGSGALPSLKEISRLTDAIHSLSRSDESSELGALKVFRIPANEPARSIAMQRLQNEIKALNDSRKGLPRLLDSDEKNGWIVTEFFPQGTLADVRNNDFYKGKVIPALKAFLSLVMTVDFLHSVHRYIHRDIKPANVFVRSDDELVLGDFGIVFIGSGERLTHTDERVGARDYMPYWAHLGTRLEKVEDNFDIYMLGKLLWSMVAGRTYLPREDFREPDFDLTVIFPNDPHMHVINRILDKCVVKNPHDCLSSAGELSKIVTSFLVALQRGGQLLSPGVPRPCRICGVTGCPLDSCVV